MAILEPLDVTALRIAESRGWFTDTSELTQVGLDWDGYQKHLNRLIALRVIRSFHLTLNIPLFLGGKWIWAAVLAKTAATPEAVAMKLVERLPFVTEIVINTALPSGIGPNLALLFYSRDFETESRFIQSLPEVKEVELFRVQEYLFPVALPLSLEERDLLQFLSANTTQPPSAIGKALGKEEKWVRAKLDRLLWRESNPTGMISLHASINWTVSANFGHFHFLLETGYNSDQLKKLLTGASFKLVLEGKPISRRFIGVEADVWGVADLLAKVEFLEKIKGIKVAGVLYNREVIINDQWVKNFLRSGSG